MTRKNKLQENLSNLKSKISEITDRDIIIVAVSKYSEFEDIKLMYELGHRDFGENRIESLEEKSLKAKELGLDDIRWHFIGHIQSNKIKRICDIPNLKIIHSIDNLKHLKKFYSHIDFDCGFFLQVNTSHEDQKGGLDESSLDSVLKEVDDDHSLKLMGLMTMAANLKEVGEARVCDSFKKLKEIAQKSHITNLSMGMSGDFHLALNYDANYIRVGSSLFKD